MKVVRKVRADGRVQFDRQFWKHPWLMQHIGEWVSIHWNDYWQTEIKVSIGNDGATIYFGERR